MYTAHVISHTHWDREWYKPFQHYRMRLVRLVDALLDLMERDENFKYFTFDGQFVVIEDYLAIRPENKGRLEKLCKEGRIILGPWYNQPDEFLVSAESLIRNLLEGRDRCLAYGNWMDVGYVPDCFGHISQLPQIMRGFGIESAALYRGITTDQADTDFTWIGTDGSALTVFNFQDDYGYGNYLYEMEDSLADPKKPLVKEDVLKQMRSLIDLMVDQRPTTSNLLFMDGCDHVFAQFKTPEVIEIVNENMGDEIHLVHDRLSDYLEALKAENPELQKFRGELRTSNRKWRCQAVLAHVLSSRQNIKDAAHRCEILLEKYTEPLYTCLSKFGIEYPRAYADLAWEYLLKNNPHDSICGCSVDQVHKDMVYRYDQCELIASQLVKDGMDDLASRIKWERAEDEKSLLMTLFNPLATEASETIDTYVHIPDEWPVRSIKVTNEDGEEVPSVLLGHDRYGLLEPTDYDIPHGEPTKKVHIAFESFAVPAMGYKSYKIAFSDRPNRQEAPLLVAPDCAQNDYLSVKVNADGTLAVWHRDSDVCYDGLMMFRDEGDIGDGYNFIKPMRDNMVTSLGAKTRISVSENSSVRVTFEIKTDLELPVGATADKQARSEKTVTCPITSYVTLGRDSKRVDVKTVFENNAGDHRLQVLFPTMLDTDVTVSETAFDVVERPIEVPLMADWTEPMPTANPQNTFMDISDENCGITLANRGLHEFEPINDDARTVAVTLLRCTYGGVRGLDLHKEGQMYGTHSFEYSIIPHSGNWEESESYREAHIFNAPPAIGTCFEPKNEGLDWEDSFMEIDSRGFVITALKQAQDKDGFILRGYNTGSENDTAVLSLNAPAEITPTDLKEDAVGETAAGEEYKFEAKPKKIVTFRIK